MMMVIAMMMMVMIRRWTLKNWRLSNAKYKPSDGWWRTNKIDNWNGINWDKIHHQLNRKMQKKSFYLKFFTTKGNKRHLTVWQFNIFEASRDWALSLARMKLMSSIFNSPSNTVLLLLQIHFLAAFKMRDYFFISSNNLNQTKPKRAKIVDGKRQMLIAKKTICWFFPFMTSQNQTKPEWKFCQNVS